jgi:hypothetical protein
MEKSSAARIVEAVLELSEQLNKVDEELRTIPDEEERKTLLRALGRIMAELDAGLIRPLVRQYPDLDPDR